VEIVVEECQRCREVDKDRRKALSGLAVPLLPKAEVEWFKKNPGI
jgi:hypothetical protein